MYLKHYPYKYIEYYNKIKENHCYPNEIECNVYFAMI